MHCGQAQILPNVPVECHAQCARCDATLHAHIPRGTQRTVAFSLAALILFIPANILPILSLSKMGYKSESTIWSGTVELWHSGTYGVATLVFLCSIVIPLSKIVGLLYLCSSHKKQLPKNNSHLIRWIEIIGRWSMLDVFLVAMLVALVKLGTIATIRPEPGIIAFAGVVVLTMIASANFDTRLLWERQETARD
jgi:paraquat-inducible protein A